MSMPKTTVDEDRRSELGKDKIWSAWKFTGVEPVPKTGTVEAPPELNLYASVGSPDPGHHFASLLLRDYVCHGNAG